jgi:hypothetical protein
MANNPDNGVSKAPPKDLELIHSSDAIVRTMYVGNPVELHYQFSPAKFMGVFGGWLYEEMVFFLLPKGSSLVHQLQRGDYLIARYLERGNAYGAKLLLRRVYPADGMLVVAWPESLEVLQISQDARIKVAYPAYLYLHCSDREIRSFDGGLVDLSSGGCRIQIARSKFAEFTPEIGKKTVISIYVPHIDKNINLSAVVRNTMGLDRQYSIGVQFHPEQEFKIRMLTGVLGHDWNL